MDSMKKIYYTHFIYKHFLVYLKLISKVFDGWKKDDIIKYCKGNLCGGRNTSCADQLSRALENTCEKVTN